VTGTTLARETMVTGRAGRLEALRSEWVKLRTVRSTTLSLLTLFGISVLFTSLASWESETSGGSPGNPGDNDLVLDTLTGIWFGQIAVAVLAVLAITSEYSVRLIRSTFAANPRRRTVLTAKTAIVAAVALAAGLVTSATCFLVGQEILQHNGFVYENGYPALTLGDWTVLRPVIGTTAYIGLLAIFALGIGTILRNTAGAITLVLAVLLAPVIAIGFLPESLAEVMEKVSLIGAGLAIQQTVERPDNIPLGPWAGLGVVAAYAATALVVALWSIAKRDT
jgi:ABC-2 type transport system permease protein